MNKVIVTIFALVFSLLIGSVAFAAEVRVVVASDFLMDAGRARVIDYKNNTLDKITLENTFYLNELLSEGWVIIHLERYRVSQHIKNDFIIILQKN